MSTQKSEIKKVIGIIGCGISGLAAIKQCLDGDLIPVCYEKRKEFGGVWCYTEEAIDGIGSVMNSTTLNTSKEMTAFSDFLMPDEFPNFLHRTYLMKYLNDYVAKFNLTNYIYFEHEVLKIEQTDCHNLSGKWIMTIKDNKNKEIFEKIFDGIMICNGHHFDPVIPKINDINLFNGQILHSHSYRRCDKFENKRVLVVGFGNSAVDIASELANVCKQVYLSTRSGGWVQSRMKSGGKPFDGIYNTRKRLFLLSLLPGDLASRIGERTVNKNFDHELYGIKPNFPMYKRQFLVNDLLPTHILTGRIKIKPDIETMTLNGVIFKGENNVTEVDIIIYSTGYKLGFPFLDKNLLPISEDGKLFLYLNMFNINLSIPHTLGFICVVQPSGSFLPYAEMQSRYFVQLIKGRCKLPNKSIMKKSIEQQQAPFSSETTIRHKIRVSYVNNMDKMAKEIKAKPNLFKYFFTDFALWKQLVFAPCIAAQYRLTGPNNWPKAREAIMTIEKRIIAPFK